MATKAQKKAKVQRQARTKAKEKAKRVAARVEKRAAAKQQPSRSSAQTQQDISRNQAIVAGTRKLGGKKPTTEQRQRALAKLKALGAPARPPPGSYDPALDIERGRTERGLSDIFADAAEKLERGEIDFGEALAQIQQQTGRTLDDLGLQEFQGLEDLGIAEERGLEDFDFQEEQLRLGRERARGSLQRGLERGTQDLDAQLAALNRAFGMLADTQRQTQNVAGTFRGGAPQAAAQKRQANLAFESAPIGTARTRLGEDVQRGFSELETDTSRDLARLTELTSRFEQDLGLQRDRLGQSVGQARTRVTQDADLATRLANLQHGRFVSDVGRDRSRAAREANQFLQFDLPSLMIENARARDPDLFAELGRRRTRRPRRR